MQALAHHCLRLEVQVGDRYRRACSRGQRALARLDMEPRRRRACCGMQLHRPS